MVVLAVATPEEYEEKMAESRAFGGKGVSSSMDEGSLESAAAVAANDSCEGINVPIQ